MSKDLMYVFRAMLPVVGDKTPEYLDALFGAKPDGFEICWLRHNEWPIDIEGFTWVPLYRTSDVKLVNHYIDLAVTLTKKNSILEERLKELGGIIDE